MLKFLKLQTLTFDPATYEKLSRAQSTYEVDGATAEINDSFEFNECLLGESDVWSIVRVEGCHPHRDRNGNVFSLSRLHLEKDTGMIVQMENFLGKPSDIKEKINKQLEVWSQEAMEEVENFTTEWSNETFKTFIKEVMAFPKKEREKYLKELNLKEAITLEFLEELKTKQLLIQEK
jgi:hypothetical protein